MCYYTASYLKLQFCRPGGVFWPFLDPREAKKGKKKGKQTNPWQKKITVKKNSRILATLQKKNHGCTIISHRATFVYFWGFFCRHTVMFNFGTKIPREGARPQGNFLSSLCVCFLPCWFPSLPLNFSPSFSLSLSLSLSLFLFFSFSLSQ